MYNKWNEKQIRDLIIVALHKYPTDIDIDILSATLSETVIQIS